MNELAQKLLYGILSALLPAILASTATGYVSLRLFEQRLSSLEETVQENRSAVKAAVEETRKAMQDLQPRLAALNGAVEKLIYRVDSVAASEAGARLRKEVEKLETTVTTLTIRVRLLESLTDFHSRPPRSPFDAE